MADKKPVKLTTDYGRAFVEQYAASDTIDDDIVSYDKTVPADWYQKSPTTVGGALDDLAAFTNKSTIATLHVWADGTSGSDANDGLTVSTPKQTLNAVFALIPFNVKHSVGVHLTGTFAAVGTLNKNVMSGGWIVIDGGTATTDIGGGEYLSDGSETAWKKTKSGAGWTVDAYAGYICQFTGGEPTTGTGDSFSIAGSVVTLIDAGAAWVGGDVGKMITIAGATTATNNGQFQIASVVSGTQITYTNSVGATEAYTGTWTMYPEKNFGWNRMIQGNTADTLTFCRGQLNVEADHFKIVRPTTELQGGLYIYTSGIFGSVMVENVYFSGTTKYLYIRCKSYFTITHVVFNSTGYVALYDATSFTITGNRYDVNLTYQGGWASSNAGLGCIYKVGTTTFYVKDNTSYMSVSQSYIHRLRMINQNNTFLFTNGCRIPGKSMANCRCVWDDATGVFGNGDPSQYPQCRGSGILAFKSDFFLGAWDYSNCGWHAIELDCCRVKIASITGSNNSYLGLLAYNGSTVHVVTTAGGGTIPTLTGTGGEIGIGVLNTNLAYNSAHETWAHIDAGLHFCKAAENTVIKPDFVR